MLTNFGKPVLGVNNMHLIFDFDGTLVDSLEKALQGFNILADEFNFRKIESAELAELKNLSSIELIKHLKIPGYKIPSVLFRARKQMRAGITTLSSFENLPLILQKLHSADFTLGILTSNSEENVNTWLLRNNMQHLFSYIHAEAGYFGKSGAIKKILKKYQINKGQAFYIGDETRDVQAAKQTGIQSVAVTWGFNAEKILREHQPDYIANMPMDLLNIFGVRE